MQSIKLLLGLELLAIALYTGFVGIPLRNGWLQRKSVTTADYCSCRSLMRHKWNEAKRFANLRKHGINFIDIPTVFDGGILTVEGVDTDVLE